MALLKWWFGISGIVLAALFSYAYVPIVIPFFVIALGLGLLTFLIVSGVRALERRIGRRPDPE
ncbi:MAG: hypothetical protein RL291_531 [Pseudomonadota bacterium]|jgi:hypothetical protein